MAHKIEFFSGNCDLCKKMLNMIIVGKCKGCELEVIDVNSENEKVKEKLKMYRINAVPTVIIDSCIKVVGIQDFPWFCGEEFYSFLKEKFPLK